jgi:cold shock CspA family protein
LLFVVLPRKFAMVVSGRNARRPAGKAAPKKPAKSDDTVDASFQVDEAARHQGRVDYFDKRRGFGFIVPSTSGLVPGDKLMIHWREITSDDKWPFLNSGIEVEFSVKKILVRQGKAALLRAGGVSLPGGASIALQEEIEDKKEFIGGKAARFYGSVKWYHTTQGYGYITLDKPQDGVSEVKVHREEVAGGYAIPMHQGLQIEFGLMKNKKGNVAAFNVTLPGGGDLSREVGEARVATGGTYTGEIDWYDYRGAQGWIVPADFEKLPKDVQESVTAQAQRRANKTGKETMETLHFRRLDMVDHTERFVKGTKVSFTVFMSQMGAGATTVKAS